MFRELSTDLENAGNTGAGAAFQTLKHANAAAKREFAIGEMDDIFNATIGRVREGAEFTSTNFALALNKIRDLRRSAELFAKDIGDAHLNRIEKTLDELRKLPNLPPLKGVNAGSMLANRQMGVGGGPGAAIGAYAGGPTGATVGGGIGAAAGAGVPVLISKMLQSEKGAKMLIDFMKSPGGITPAKTAAMAMFVRGIGASKE